MTSSNPDPTRAATRILLIGTLGGFGLAVVFLLISGLTYLVLSALGLSRDVAITAAVTSGPIAGIALVIVYLVLRSKRTT